MKKTDINQLISAYYDNELTEGELDYLLEATKKDPELLSKLKNYGLIWFIHTPLLHLLSKLKTKYCFWLLFLLCRCRMNL